MRKSFWVYVDGKLLMAKTTAEKAYGAAELHMSQRRDVWVLSRPIPA